MAYDPENINSGLIAGFNDINPNLGLPAIPMPPSPAVEEKEGGGEDKEGEDEVIEVVGNTTNSNATSEETVETEKVETEKVETENSKVVLPAGLAVPICDTSLVIIDKTKSASGEKAPCESLEDTKKKLGASAYAALEEIIDAQALLEDKKTIIAMLPEGAEVETR